MGLAIIDQKSDFSSNNIGVFDKVCNVVRKKVNSNNVEACYIYALSWGLYMDDVIDSLGQLDIDIGIHRINKDNERIGRSLVLSLCNDAEGEERKVDVYVNAVTQESNFYVFNISVEVTEPGVKTVFVSNNYTSPTQYYFNVKLHVDTLNKECSGTCRSDELTFTSSTSIILSSSEEEDVEPPFSNGYGLYIDSASRELTGDRYCRIWRIKASNEQHELLNVPLLPNDTLMDFANNARLAKIGLENRKPAKSSVRITEI